MKIFILFSLTLSYLFCDAKLIANIDKTFQEVINQSRAKKVDDIKVDYDPFSVKVSKPTTKNAKINDKTETEPKNSSKKPILSMVLNKKAFIDGKWYKEGEKFADYLIREINQDIVILEKNSRYTTLKLPLSDTILITHQEIE